MSRILNKKIGQKIRAMPDSPGVYIMKDRKGKVIYIGKAKNLSNRVRSYFQKSEILDIKTARLVSAVKDIDFIVTDNEVEALALECNLIKEYKPRYNIRLKDDKRYPYIKITLKEKFPRIFLVRRIEDDGSEYYGPYTDVKSLRKTLSTIRTIFPLRDCPGKKPGRESGRECLNFFIKRCTAPCTGRIDEEGYREIVEELRLFLKGRSKDLLKKLEGRMWKLSREKRYEEAAVVRDQLRSFQRVLEKQIVASPKAEDFDIVSMSRSGRIACCVVMMVREGKILGSQPFIIPVNKEDSDNEIFEGFIKLYYISTTGVPKKIYIQIPLDSKDIFEQWLAHKRGGKVKIVIPKIGEKLNLLRLAEKNASYRLSLELSTRAYDLTVLKKLASLIGLSNIPERIEAFDISNIRGEFAVGSMVVFQDGKPLKSSYRHFKIKTVEGIDDYLMIEEVLARRLEHIKTGRDRAPDLLVIDGGKGHLNSAIRAMKQMEITNIPVISIAKAEEIIYTPSKTEPIKLSRSDEVLKLIQRLRDEAHRFAVQYHRKLREKSIRKSVLDEIPGIGKKRKEMLLKFIGSLEKIKNSSLEEISSVPGIGPKIAKEIYEYLHRQ